MKLKTIIIIVVGSLCCWFLLFLLVLNINPFLPVHEVTEQDGTSVIIDGVRYKSSPQLRWHVHGSAGEKIGYAGNWWTSLYWIEGDPNRNFLYSVGLFSSTVDPTLYRTDKEVPQPSAESVDVIEWKEYYADEDGYRKKGYENIIKDKEIIKELFNTLESGEKCYRSYDSNFIEWIFISISCTAQDLPVARYNLNMGVNGNTGRILCGNLIDGYVEVPLELLEKMAGKEIDVDSIITADEYFNSINNMD
ncbi:MAG: hypothetical protein ACOYJD_03515 [Christensenellales bacterium]|jgi:hypothetical protein